MSIPTRVLGCVITVLFLAGCASSSSVESEKNRFDTDRDGFLTPQEYAASDLSRLVTFEELDADSDGLLSQSELSFIVPDETRKRDGGREGGRGGRSRT